MLRPRGAAARGMERLRGHLGAGDCGWPLHPGILGKRQRRPRGKAAGRRRTPLLRDAGVAPRLPVVGLSSRERGHLGAGGGTVVLDGAWGCAPLFPPRASPRGARRPSEPRSGPRGSPCPAASPAPAFPHDPRSGLGPGGQSGEGEAGGAGARVHSGVRDASGRTLPRPRSAPFARGAGAFRARRGTRGVRLRGTAGGRGGAPGGGAGAGSGVPRSHPAGASPGRADAGPRVAVLAEAPPGAIAEGKMGRGTGDGHFGAQRRRARGRRFSSSLPAR